MQKNDGSWTYFANDVGYHMDKVNRNYEYLIDDCNPSVVIVSDQVQYNKIKNIVKSKPFIKKILSFAKNKYIYTAIDNTWGTPYLIKPLDLGFDMSIVSATKYYSGHSDVMGGSLAIKKRLFKEVELSQKAVGLRLSPDDAYLIMRGLRTLDIRLDKHQENTIKVANFLSKQKKVKEVFYPIKKNIKQYKMWKKYYSGSSGLMGVKIISKNKNSVIKFLNKLKLFAHGYSWGGFESLALYQDKLALGNRSYTKLSNNEHIIRLHIGLEDPNDLIADIKQAIKSVR